MMIGIGIGLRFARGSAAPSNVSPTCAITSPAPGATVHATVALTVSGTWSDASGAPTGRLYMGDVATGRDLGAVTVDPGGTWTIALPAVTGILVSDAGGTGTPRTLTLRMTDALDPTKTTDATLSIVVYHPALETLCVAWYQADLGRTEVNAACNALAAWTGTGLTDWTGTTITENGATSEHCIAGTSDIAAGPAQMTVRITPSGRTWFRVALGAATCFFQLTGAGTVGTAANCTGTIVAAGGGAYDCTITVAAAAAAAIPKVSASTNGSLISYAGNSAAAGTIASATVTQTRVSAWADQSSAGANLAQATPAKQPFVWSGSTWSASAGLLFKGSGVSGQDLSALTASDAQPNTELAIVTPTLPSAVTYGFVDGIAARNAIYASADSITMFGGLGIATGLLLVEGVNSIVGVFNGTSSYGRRNGVQGSNVNASTGARDDIYVGGQSSGNNHFNGYYHAASCFSGALDAPTIARLSAWTTAKYGVAT